MTTITADEAKPGDVVLDPGGKLWRAGTGGPDRWSTFDGPIAFFGPWKPEYGPQGDLDLLMRGGQVVR